MLSSSCQSLCVVLCLYFLFYVAMRQTQSFTPNGIFLVVVVLVGGIVLRKGCK